MSKTVETFHSSFSGFVSVFYFKCATVEMKHYFISVLFHHYLSVASNNSHSK